MASARIALFDIDGTLLITGGAHAAGIQCVAVVSHHFNVEQLREAGADYAIGSLEEALPL